MSDLIDHPVARKTAAVFLTLQVAANVLFYEAWAYAMLQAVIVCLLWESAGLLAYRRRVTEAWKRVGAMEAEWQRRHPA